MGGKILLVTLLCSSQKIQEGEESVLGEKGSAGLQQGGETRETLKRKKSKGERGKRV